MLLLTLLLGCPTGLDANNCATPEAFYADADGDGFGDLSAEREACAAPAGTVTDATDCDDTDPAVHPGAVEVCGGGDEDCDGSVDEDDAADATLWYADADADTYGDPAVSSAACAAPEGAVADSSDCDDRDSWAHPGGTEVCGGGDEDCDGVVDEADAADATIWYGDGDGDGFGDAEVSSTSCTQPAGSAADASDCDDSDAAIHPGADERCGGGDEDCDGVVDEDDAADATTWYADTDGDTYGDASAGSTSCNEPTGSVSDATDCDDTDPTARPGGTELCGGGDEDCDGVVDEDDAADASIWYADTDGDTYGARSAPSSACSAPAGVVADATDCDDGDAAIHPGADEVCGGADEDCDGVVDEDDTADAETWYADGDGDGYGDPATASTACTAPSGSVSDATDCDDTDAGTNPAGVEWCGGGDEDCDGAVDEADATDAASWYADTDADGYGDSAAMTVACAAPSGTVADATDCDDTDGASHPGANELCGGDDEDCDGTVDEDDASDAGTWHADADADGYGDAASSTLACVAPSGTLADGSDCDDTDSAVSPAATEVCLDGVDNDCSGDSGGCELSDGSLANADVIIDIDTPSTSFGHGVWTPGDVDGDGYGDLIVHQAAPVYLRYMTGPYVDEVADSSRWSATFELYSASRVATGDLDGDGYADLAVNDQRTGPTTSTLDIFPGPWSGTYSTADATYSLTEDRYRASNDSSAGDLDGDGLDELIVGCLSCGTSRQGRVFVMFGPPVTGTTFAAASLVFDGTSASQELGAQVEFAPDTNGDGYGDLIIASEVSTGMYVFLGPDVGGGDVTAADAVIESFESQTETLSVGDADGDGLTDLLAGADDTNSMGTTITSYLCLAPWTGTMSITDAWATFAGESSDASLEAVHMLDIDGDGRAEPVITVTRGERGETEVFLEPSGGVVSHADADATFTGERYWDSAMNLPPTPGDLNADGTDDLVIGAPGYDDGDYDGRVYIVHGNGE